MINWVPIYQLVSLLPEIYVSIWQLWFVLLVLASVAFEMWNTRRHR